MDDMANIYHMETAISYGAYGTDYAVSMYDPESQYAACDADRLDAPDCADGVMK